MHIPDTIPMLFFGLLLLAAAILCSERVRAQLHRWGATPTGLFWIGWVCGLTIGGTILLGTLT